MNTARIKVIQCRKRAGVAATEFALTLPFLLLVALGSVDFGRIAYFDEIVSNAARTGAETGATHSFTTFTRTSWEAGIKQSVLDEMQNIPSFSSGKLTYQLTVTTDSDGLSTVVVDVTYPFQTIVAWPALPTTVNLHQKFGIRQFK